MAIVTGDRYLDQLVRFVDRNAGTLLDGALVLKVNPVGLHYVQSRLEQLQELEGLLAGAPVDYLRAYISDLGDHRALEQLRRILRLLPSLKVVSVLPPPARDPTPLSLLHFGRLRVLEIRGCDLSTSAARGLLELRHTLEKIVCHNSTDALRHVFSSRIVDIKDSAAWNRLSFVSCACNGLVLMDESLQLLPAVEMLDLSRNRFAKVNNLRKCTELKHLDLGFNHLRTIASLSEVACPIVKLVLRNNALTALRGIENLKFIEGLDVSYNIISNFSELEILGALTSLHDLWLEGNPICCARWYRPHIFSFFTNPEQLTLDEKRISTRESWERQIILASRRGHPAGHGFYSPARDASEEGGFNTKRTRMSRLACIQDGEQRSFYGSDVLDEESAVSCDSGSQRRDESVISEGDAEIVGLMSRVEFMKKERSVLWLREFREWMDQASGDMEFRGLIPGKGKYSSNRNGPWLLGESSRHALDSVQYSEDESSTNFFDSEMSLTDAPVGYDGRDYFKSKGGKAALLAPTKHFKGEAIPSVDSAGLEQEHLISFAPEELNRPPEDVNPLLVAVTNSFLSGTLITEGDNSNYVKVNASSLTAIEEILEARSTSCNHGSPPQYQEDILQRRQNLEEEYLQLSAESYSLASSDSDTSCDDDDSCKFCTSFAENDHLFKESLNGSMGIIRSSLLFENAVGGGNEEKVKPEISLDFFHASRSEVDLCADVADETTDDVAHFEIKRGKRKPKRRIVSLSEEDSVVRNKSDSILEIEDVVDRLKQHPFGENGILMLCTIDQKQESKNKLKNHGDYNFFGGAKAGQSPTLDIKNYFNDYIADLTVTEKCLQCTHCSCLHTQGSGYFEIDVVVLVSSERKLYILVVEAKHDGSGNISTVLGCHRLEDIKEIAIGLSLQVLRVYIEKDLSYLLIIRDLEESRMLLCLLQVCDVSGTQSRCVLRSWEQVQVKLFEKDICGGLKMNLYQYSMLLFWHNKSKGGSWLSRSLFVVEGYVLVCFEHLVQFGSLTADEAADGVSSPYFSLDSCCHIRNISEMVIDSEESRCITLTLDFAISENVHLLAELHNKKHVGKKSSKAVVWKLKWFSEDSLLKFVALIKAIHLGITMSNLSIQWVS